MESIGDMMVSMSPRYVNTVISVGFWKASLISSSVAPWAFIILYLSLWRIERSSIAFTSDGFRLVVKGAFFLSLFSFLNSGWRYPPTCLRTASSAYFCILESRVVKIFRPSVYTLYGSPFFFTFLLHHPYRGSVSHASESMLYCTRFHDGYLLLSGFFAIMYWRRNSRKYVAMPSLWSERLKLRASGFSVAMRYSPRVIFPALSICPSTTLRLSRHLSG